jgi:hypothetical protein
MQAHTYLVHMHRSTLYNLHCISQVHKVFVIALFLLGNERITLDSEDEPFCKLERDAEKSSFWDFVKSHLLK